MSSALGLAFATLGSETSGSILSPSEVSNLVGIKPTVGLTSRTLVIPISEHQDTVGPMARTVKDAAYVLQAIAGKDPFDNYTLAQPFDTPPDYVAACNFSSLRGKRIGVPRNLIDPSEDPDNTVIDAFNAAVKLIARAGATVVDNTNITEYALETYTNGSAEGIVLDADFVSDLPGKYLSMLSYNPQNVQNLEDVRNFTQNFPLEDYPDRDTAVWDESLALGYGNTDPRFCKSGFESVFILVNKIRFYWKSYEDRLCGQSYRSPSSTSRKPETLLIPQKSLSWPALPR